MVNSIQGPGWPASQTNSGWAASHTMTAEAAMKLIRPGSRIYLGNGAAAPHELLARLETMSHAPDDIEFISFATLGATDTLDGLPRTRFRHCVYFVGRDVRGLPPGKVDYVPIRLEEVPRLLASGRLAIDAALLQVAPPDTRGFVNLGLSVDLTPAVLEVARLVIAEVNPAMPRLRGETSVPVTRFDALVPVDRPIAEYRHQEVGETARRIARYIAALVEDGSTLQIGLGRVPAELLSYLTDRRNLGVHSDVVTDGVADLMEAGVITNAHKPRWRHRTVASYALGTRRLYDHMDDNPAYAVLPIDRVCDAVEIASNPAMTSITQALSIDITGSVCIDQYRGGFGGGISTQMAFQRGASRSENGKPIICLESTEKDGSSRIFPTLPAEYGVGVARSDVHYVITEWGIAYLFGRSIRERAVALIDVAHPDHREGLLAEAKRLGYVPKQQYLASHAAYPVEEEHMVSLRDGREVLIRPARATDADALLALFHDMTEDDVYTRFFRRMRSLSQAELQNLCNVNHETEVAFFAVTGPRENEKLVGSCCYFLNPTSNMAEVAFMLAPEWKGAGLGIVLLEQLQQYALRRGVRGFTAEVLPENAAMLALAKGATARVSTQRDGDVVHVTMLFNRPEGPAE